jgi:membrane-bound metal-dependent hydrolase YbcI (DUF457 family)
MMGHSHALSGAVAWLALAPAAAAAAGHPLSGASVLGGTLACAGAALLPDMDHPDGTIAHFFGLPSEWVAKLVSWISGGHRHATHSLIFCAVTGGGTFALQHYVGHKAMLVLLLVLIGLAIRGLGIAPPRAGKHWAGFAILLQSILVTWVVDSHIDGPWLWMVPSVTLGTFMHLFGDCLTRQGCPLLWPVRQRFGIHLISRTGNWLETKLLAPLMTVAAAALFGYLFWSSFVNYWQKT